MAENLTVDNFVQEIKAMNEREKARLRVDKLIELIIQLSDATTQICLRRLMVCYHNQSPWNISTKLLSSQLNLRFNQEQLVGIKMAI